jgi:aspartate racemase
MNKTLGILGGMGPLATADLFKKIVMMTEAECDQDHIRIIIDSNTQIPDRTAFLVSNGEDPTPCMIKSAQLLEKAGADCLIMPCNTAHYFYDSVVKSINIPFLNMLEETAKELNQDYAYAKTIGLLATVGTCTTGIYTDIFSRYSINVVKPDQHYQQYVTELIYNIKKGIYDFDLSNFSKTLEVMKNEGAEVFVLGCTEIPIAFDTFKLNENVIDPTTVIAKSAIKFLGKELKKV